MELEARERDEDAVVKEEAEEEEEAEMKQDVVNGGALDRRDSEEAEDEADAETEVEEEVIFNGDGSAEFFFPEVDG